ncbi:MAG TPA: MoxR family ATPase [Gemmatimonadaceae bacterium]|nr:MoxR family ATPase [Gemmatimonadaceae bacterium]
MRAEIRRIQELMERESYITDRGVATAIHLATALRKPLLVEGPPGVGKTDIAKVLARVLDTELIRLQCYEGLDATTALYEWNYPRQMLHIRLEEGAGHAPAAVEASIFSEAFLLKRPLLQAITYRGERGPVLLIDEVDRSDEEFEAFLLEVLSDFQVTIPEIGTIAATHVPSVVLTSNRSRDLSDALRRRCLYLWIDHPSFEKELRIVRSKVPGIEERLAAEISIFMHALRRRRLAKTPGIAETLDWANALVVLHAAHLDAELVRETMGCFLKDEEDVRAFGEELGAGGLEAMLTPLA